MSENLKTCFSLKRFFPYINSVNFGIFIICTHIFLDLGAFQQLVDFVAPLKIPFLVSSLTVLYALSLVMSGKFHLLQSKLSLSFTVFFLFVLFYSLISSKNIQIRNEGLKLLLTYYSIFIIGSCSVKNIFQLSLVLDSYLLAILHSCYHGIRQGGLIWSSKWLGDENEISILVVCAIPYAFMLFQLHKNIIRRILYIFSLAVYLTLIVVANSRGGALALFATGFFCWTFIEKKFRALLFIFIAGIGISLFAPQKWFNEIKTIQQGTSESTAFDRSYGWKLASLMFRDYPVCGVGMFNYPELYVPYNLQYRIKADRHPKRDPHIKRVAHSTPIEWIAETGILGTLIFSFMLSSIHSNWKYINIRSKSDIDESVQYIKTFNNATIVAMIGFWTGALTVSVLFWPFFWFLLLFCEMVKNVHNRLASSTNKS
jgi:hypothetical protein